MLNNVLNQGLGHALCLGSLIKDGEIVQLLFVIEGFLSFLAKLVAVVFAEERAYHVCISASLSVRFELAKLFETELVADFTTQLILAVFFLSLLHALFDGSQECLIFNACDLVARCKIFSIAQNGLRVEDRKVYCVNQVKRHFFDERVMIRHLSMLVLVVLARDV